MILYWIKWASPHVKCRKYYRICFQIFEKVKSAQFERSCFRFFVFPYIEYILGLNEEKPFKAILKNNFTKKKNFTRFAKSKLNTTKNGKIEVEILQGQESFRITSFVKSNIWSLLPSGKSNFKKGDIVDCFFPNQSNSTLI